MSVYRHREADTAVQLLRDTFFSRKDRIAFLAPWKSPCPAEVNGNLDSILRAHIFGRQAPKVTINYRARRRKGALEGRFRIGSYTPAPDGTTRWLCIDYDGAGHAHALDDPKTAATSGHEVFSRNGLPVYLEQSGGGQGWHLWCFFKEPIPASRARQLAEALLPDEARLSNGDVVRLSQGRAVEIFPKQITVSRSGYGNFVWLPWWSDVPQECNAFYRPTRSGRLEPFTPIEFETVDVGLLSSILLEPESDKVNKYPKKISVEKSLGEEWKAWRRRVLIQLPLESVYDEWITGRPAGNGWIQCRDPDSPSGDQRPSAGVADGTGQAERGSFHSFISGETISVFDFLVRRGRASDFREAVHQVADLIGVKLPVGLPTPTRTGSEYALPSLETIQVNKRQLRDIVADAWKAVNKANRNNTFTSKSLPFLFLRQGSLVNVKLDDDTPRIELVSKTAMYGLLTRSADWVRETRDGLIGAKMDKDTAHDMLVYPDIHVPRLADVISSPVFGEDGAFITKPGYDEKEQLWLHQGKNLKVPKLPAQPTQEQTERSRDFILHELLGDFPVPV